MGHRSMSGKGDRSFRGRKQTTDHNNFERWTKSVRGGLFHT